MCADLWFWPYSCRPQSPKSQTSTKKYHQKQLSSSKLVFHFLWYETLPEDRDCHNLVFRTEPLTARSRHLSSLHSQVQQKATQYRTVKNRKVCISQYLEAVHCDSYDHRLNRRRAKTSGATKLRIPYSQLLNTVSRCPQNATVCSKLNSFKASSINSCTSVV